MRFVCDEGEVGLLIDGDCCSESWFADFTGVPELIGARVLKVETVDLPAPSDTRTRQQWDEAYGFKIFHTRGIADLVFRNSSNGYYGGWANAGRVPNATKPITDDWNA